MSLCALQTFHLSRQCMIWANLYLLLSSEKEKRTKDTSKILWIKIWTKIWWETGEDDQVGQKESGGIKIKIRINKKNYELKSE